MPSEKEIRSALLRELYAAKDFSLKTTEAYGRTYEYFETKISDDDVQFSYGNSYSKWANEVQWVRQHLVSEGYILPPSKSGRGKWKLSEKGVSFARKLYIDSYGDDPHESINDIAKIDIANFEDEHEVFEGKKKERLSSYYERKAENRVRAIECHGLKCNACGFDFEKRYGKLGHQFIEVHHLIPVSSLGGEKIINPKTEMTTLCANCHRMIHKEKTKVLGLEDLKNILKENSGV